jgi:NhaA family Na+:H+ antiporter
MDATDAAPEKPPAPKPVPHTWVESDGFVPRVFVRPALRFMHLEAAGGVVMLGAAVVALLWANSPFQGGYEAFWETPVDFSIGDLLHIEESLRMWVNEGLMAIFFFVMALEIKREIVHGELSDPRAASVPVLAALGGMVVPALVYVAFNAGGPGADGWGIPMATDIAFAVGVIALAGPRVPVGVKIFLLTLAIADDIGAILIIAVFYTEDVSLEWLAVAIAVIPAVVILQRMRVRSQIPVVMLAIVMWISLLEAGVSPTLAGVTMGLLAPAWSFYDPSLFAPRARVIVDKVQRRFRDEELDTEELERTQSDLADLVTLSRETIAPVSRNLFFLERWVAFAVVPLFALANAGVELTGETLADPLGDDVLMGVALGLIIGKPVGVFAFTWVAVTLGIGRLPFGATWRHIFGVGIVSGIGFTVALFVASLAFDDPALNDSAKIGILVGSLVAGVAGWALLRTSHEPTGSADQVAGDGHRPTAAAAVEQA